MSIAFVFPGQGSQSVGMLDVWVQQPEIDGLLRDADEALGEPLCRLIHEGPADKLASTVNTQPAMLLAGVCAWRAWQALGGPPPHLVAGHSLGEYAALVAAGVFRPSDALRLVRLRAIAMQEAVPEGSGAMAAILGLEDAAVIESCAIVSAQSGQLLRLVVGQARRLRPQHLGHRGGVAVFQQVVGHLNRIGAVAVQGAEQLQR
ncbi:MAG: ACP S-malonyltransferase, partial [Betaproteobacteria bacterium]|nr:ACP S-malonyltransferase [Betaproteobacteria bacterium]